MYPHKHIIHRRVYEHWVGAVLHLLVCPSGHNIVPADCLLGQVQVRHKSDPLGPGQVKYVSPERLSSLIAVHPKVAKLTVRTVETHVVPCALASPIVENHGPLLPVVQPGEGVLRPVRQVRHLHILAEAPAGVGSAGRAVSFPNRAAFFGEQGFPGGTQTGELLMAGYKTQYETDDYQRPHYSKVLPWTPPANEGNAQSWQVMLSQA